MFKPEYVRSWALVVGIDEYRDAPPLRFAVSDAEAVTNVLMDAFEFPEGNVTQLLNEDATASRIQAALYQLTSSNVSSDDRVLIFFAGHGVTAQGNRGEVGFLAPVEGNPADLSTLIRWQEFIAPSELISAKHLLYVMDACYGGLALTRGGRAAGGSRRFLKDMLQRYSRQVITGGKADERVSDSGGPRPDHSVFTGHLLDALDGAAESTDGVLTATNVMGYVYDKVSRDYESRQTPHYGFLDGDGDFIFDLGNTFGEQSNDEGIDQDVMVSLGSATDMNDAERSHVDRLKEYIVDDRHRIRLDDLIRQEIREVMSRMVSDRFPIDTTSVSAEDIQERLSDYEEVCDELLDYVVVLSRWADGERQRRLLTRIARGLSDFEGVVSGKVVWIGLRWYPLLLAAYSGGIAALADGQYQNLYILLHAQAGAARTRDGPRDVAVAMVNGINEADVHEVFKKLPGHERHRVPRSEYLFRQLQARLEDLLLLGREYEDKFDRFEVLLGLTYMDIVSEGATTEQRVWGPFGRFAWKWHGRQGRDPFSAFVKEGLQAGADWPILQAGFFGGDIDRFEMVAARFRDDVLANARMW